MLSIQEISDHIELDQLLTAYATAIDRMDMVALDDVFTADAWIDYTAFADFGGIKGHYPEIRTWLERGLRLLPAFQHLMANQAITLDGDQARGRIMCLNPTATPVQDHHGRPIVGFHGLWYNDEYVRTGAGWRICRRVEERSFSHNFPPGWPKLR